MNIIEHDLYIDGFLKLTELEITKIFIEISEITKSVVKDPIKELWDSEGLITRNAMALIGIYLPSVNGYDTVHKKSLQTAFYEWTSRKRKELILLRTKNISKYGEAIDLQAVNKLASQKGYNIGHAGDTIIVNGKQETIPEKSGLYFLESIDDLSKTHPTYEALKRARLYTGNDLNEIFLQMKKDRDQKCWGCNSKEGEINIRTNQITGNLQQGHMISSQALAKNNMLPLCSYCNGPFRDDFDFAPNGAAIKKRG